MIATKVRDVAQPGSASLRGGSVAVIMNYFVYILFSERIKKFYCGVTENVNKRLREHNAGKGDFTSKGVPWTLVTIFEKISRLEALEFELKIKKRGIKRYLDDLK